MPGVFVISVKKAECKITLRFNVKVLLKTPMRCERIAF